MVWSFTLYSNFSVRIQIIFSSNKPPKFGLLVYTTVLHGEHKYVICRFVVKSSLVIVVTNIYLDTSLPVVCIGWEAMSLSMRCD